MSLTAADRWCAGLVFGFGLALALALVPGVFTIDECNHLAAVAALRHGRLDLPGYEGIAPSAELAFFNPRKGLPAASPPVNDLPPLYAFIALPFSLLGFRGLFYLNALAFLGTLVAVFHLGRRLASDRRITPWVAAALFALGGYSIEYALGMWPHMLSVCLCTCGFLFASAVRQPPASGSSLEEGVSSGFKAAFFAGLLLGAATGIRYQNVVYATGVAVGLLLWASSRRRAITGYAAGLAVPLGATSVLNYLRLGSFNPISKGHGYLALRGLLTPPASEPLAEVGAGGAGAGGAGTLLGQIIRAFWYRVVDYSACPAIDFGDFFPRPSLESGAYLFYGVAKKAWLQSSPWAVVALVALLSVWLTGRGESKAGAEKSDADRAAGESRQHLRAISLVVWPVLAMFAVVGARRTDGICFNQRYFLELVPLSALAVALLLERYALSRAALLAALPSGTALGVAAGVWALAWQQGAARDMAVMQLPLWMSGLVLLAWAAAEVDRERGAAKGSRGLSSAAVVLVFVLAACLGWSLAVHLGEDVRVARQRRAFTEGQLSDLRSELPDGSAVLTWTYLRNAAAPLLLERDVLIIDASRDAGRDAPMLVRQLKRQGRRVFLVKNLFDWKIRRGLVARYGVASFRSGVVDLLELGDSGRRGRFGGAANRKPR